ncbi:MAG TPA: hypothetical protein VKZ53_01390 [Candidatus Angelobacter sp.]|nr:hypothetical protein [Candidatus Angelobacter sp.]
MIFDLITIFLVGLVLILAVYTVLQFLGKFPNRTISDVGPYLRPTELQELDDILDPVAEVNFRLNLSNHEFRQLQRKRIHLVRECLLRMSHNALILIEWGNMEWMGPSESEFSERQQLGRELVQAATEFRLYSLLALAKLKIWIVLRLEIWPFLAPSISALRKMAGIDAVRAYLRLKEAAAFLGHACGGQEELSSKL